MGKKPFRNKFKRLVTLCTSTTPKYTVTQRTDGMINDGVEIAWDGNAYDIYYYVHSYRYTRIRNESVLMFRRG